MELDGKAALITGGTTGIGFSIAEAFLSEGGRVVITGRDADLGATAERRLRARGEARFLKADAADEGQVIDSTAKAVALLGGLDVLVNNAGIGVLATPLDTPLGDFDRIMAVNVRGYLAYARACFPHLEARGGSMIHISSDAGLQGEVEIGIYSVSKAAVNMLSNVLAIEGARRGVRSNAICPGDIEPGMRHMGPPPDPDRPEEGPPGWLVPPVGRIGHGADVAHAAVYLASDRASFVNGAVLPVDGGMRAGHNTARLPDSS
jgi:NAD(P)-dependent dehydrogenase (short-subunit alcohol dehydrogenase family)